MPLFKTASTTEPPWTPVAPITVMIGDMNFSFSKGCYKELVLYELLANGRLRNAGNGSSPLLCLDVESHPMRVDLFLKNSGGLPTCRHITISKTLVR